MHLFYLGKGLSVKTMLLVTELPTRSPLRVLIADPRIKERHVVTGLKLDCRNVIIILAFAWNQPKLDTIVNRFVWSDANVGELRIAERRKTCLLYTSPSPRDRG